MRRIKITDRIVRNITRVSVTLVLSLAILIISTYITIGMIKGRLENYAEAEAEQKTILVNNVSNLLFLSHEWIVHSFLSGMTDIRYYEDSTTNEKKLMHVFRDNVLDNLTVNDIYDRLNTFISYHTDFKSVIFIVEPGKLKHCPYGIAAKMLPNDSVRYDLTIDYDIYNSTFYKSVRDSNGTASSAGYITEDSLFVYSIGTPLYDSQGGVIGEFWIDTDADFFSDILIKYADQGVIFAFINADCRIVASTNRENNGKYIKDVAIRACGMDFPEEWYSEVEKSVRSGEKNHFLYDIKGEKVITYILPMKMSKYKLLVIKPERQLHDEVNDFIWLPIAIMLVSIVIVFICMVYIFLTFKRKDEISSRMESEMKVAARIQERILPPAMKENERFDIHGFLRPAKTVGGDMYDYALKGENLHFCIGDVSGKGMPSAMVMAEICSLYRYVISRSSDPKETVTEINKAVMERSDDSMFCTLFVGVLNLRSGELRYCNAGHNPPILIGKERSEFMRIKPNMPINAFEEFGYQSESLMLSPGDRLFLYTDGVTEARNGNNLFFGNEATLAAVERHRGLTSEEMIGKIIRELRAFTGKAEQNDDITILCVEHKGMDNGVTLHYDGIKGRVTEIVDEVMKSCGLAEEMRLRLAVEEPVQNISDYAYSGDGPLDVQIERMGDLVEITLTDSGLPFNPLEQKSPEINAPIEEREIGGLGIFLTRQIMEEVTYSYQNGKNILKLKYKIETNI